MGVSIGRKSILTACTLLAWLAVCGTLFADDAKGRRIDDLRKRLKSLRSVPYTMLTQDEVDLTTAGVRVYDKDLAWKGYNLYCSRTRSQAVLMDMDGNVVNRWSYPADEHYRWNHAILPANGDLVVIRKFRDLLRLDWNSNLVWCVEMEVHHEIIEAEDGTFYAVVREIENHRGMESRFPAIVHLTCITSSI